MMLIGYSSGAQASVATIGGAGGGRFLNSTEDGLVDGLPARVARLEWFVAAGTTATALTIPVSYGAAYPHRLAVVRGLTLPAGTLMRVSLLDASSAVVAYLDQRAVLFGDGTVGAWFIFPAGTLPSKFAELSIYNDINGVASITSAEVFEIGEFAVMPLVDIAIQEDWSDESIDPTETTLTRDSQPASVVRLPYRKVEVMLSASTYAQAYDGALDGGMDLVRLREAFAGDAPVVAIPRWRSEAGVLVQSLVDSTAVFGTARMSKLQHIGGDYYDAGVVFTESPATT